jgi:NAD(P)-dependent dehydrogenase (short-subunit alcohol dehydrogenase family)
VRRAACDLCATKTALAPPKQGGGAVVNTSPGAGVKGFKGQAAYAAAKYGVIGHMS